MKEYGMGFLLTVSYFTRIPIGSFVEYTEERFKKGAVLFPFVGLLLSLLLFGLMNMLEFFGLEDAQLFFHVLLLIGYAVLSGGIHIDGLADSFDGFFSGREKEKILQIMQDPHIGTFGILGILGVYLINLAAIFEADTASALLFPYVARVHSYALATFLPYAKEKGMGKIFVDQAKQTFALLHYFLMFVVIFLFFPYDHPAIWYSVLLSFVISASGAALSAKKIGGLTGDSMGFLIEIAQMGYLSGLVFWG